MLFQKLSHNSLHDAEPFIPLIPSVIRHSDTSDDSGDDSAGDGDDGPGHDHDGHVGAVPVDVAVPVVVVAVVFAVVVVIVVVVVFGRAGRALLVRLAGLTELAAHLGLGVTIPHAVHRGRVWHRPRMCGYYHAHCSRNI